MRRVAVTVTDTVKTMETVVATSKANAVSMTRKEWLFYQKIIKNTCTVVKGFIEACNQSISGLMATMSFPTLNGYKVKNLKLGLK